MGLTSKSQRVFSGWFYTSQPKVVLHPHLPLHLDPWGGSGLVPATIGLHYFLYFQGGELVHTVNQVFFSVHLALFNSLVTNVDLMNEHHLNMGGGRVGGWKHLILSLQLHKSLGLLLTPNMLLLQWSLNYSSHTVFYTKDDKRPYWTETHTWQMRERPWVGQCDPTTSSALKVQ